MLQIGNKPIDTMHVGGKMVQQVYLGGKKIYPEHGVIPKAIKDAMVLWYDIKRQGATNESMAENPVLRDLSGNGHDATCYNFAWTEESGISTTNYPNALVSDGVDDYAIIYNLPVLNDWTIFIKKDIVEYPTNHGWLLVDGGNAGDSTLQYKYEANVFYINSFGYTTNVTDYVEKLDVFTPTSFNGNYIQKGDCQAERTSLYLFGGASLPWISMALHSVIVFNRTLTTEEIEWVKTNLIEGNDDDAEDWYGVEFYTTSPYPDCIRIGNPELHKTLPVHTQMKGCLLSDDGTVNKYLNESNWTSETLDGSQGQVMVEMPKQSYWKFETDGNIRRVKFSTKPLEGFNPTPQGYVSAYEASLQRSTNKLSSVVNTDENYRGGNNNAEWDGTYRSLLGMPATQISRTNLRNYARNRKADSSEWNCMTYDFQKLLYWLFVVEYATLNSQKTFNPYKDTNGYAQGGLGNGVTNLNRDKWTNFNSSYPFVPCGYTDELGNGTGEVEFSMPEEYDSAGLTVKVARYRGIENPFGHIWKWTDGCKCLIQSEADGGLSEFYVCDDPAAFTSSGTTNYELRGNLPRKERYVKKMILGEDGEIMPLEVGAGSTTYFCDYFYTKIPASGVSERGVLFGGNASSGAFAGFVFAYTNRTATDTSADFGSRLCFIPNNN